MRPRGTVLGIKSNRSSKAARPEFESNAPPMCQPCGDKRRQAGAPISRLVFRPKALLICIDCGVTVSDDRPKKKAA